MENRHFTLIVVGENPDELVKKYDSTIKVEPYVVLQFKNAGELHKKHIHFYEEMLLKLDPSDANYKVAEEQLSLYREQSDIDFFADITEEYEIDEETGDAISDENPDGKYVSCKIGKNFSLPLINKNGEEVYSCRKSNVDWSKIHLANKEPYEFAWDSVMEGKKPENDAEKNIYENMKNRVSYFNAYGNRENYVLSNTSFWGFAFLSEKTGWVELEDTVNQFEWVRSFFDRFIKPLGENEKISVYECVR
jgi:hypothetical protein